MFQHMPYSSRRLLTSRDLDHDADDSDTCSIVSLPPFSSPPSVGGSSYTSYDASMRSGSPTPSVRSMTSSILAQAFKHEFGRGINNYSEVYRLPADEEELDRLGNTQLIIFTSLRLSIHFQRNNTQCSRK